MYPTDHKIVKKYYIVLDLLAHRVNWDKLYNPIQYELILLAFPPHPIPGNVYEILEKQLQLKYFNKIVKINSLRYVDLKESVKKIILDLEKNGVKRNQIKLIGNGELLLQKTALLREEFNLQGVNSKEITVFRNKLITKSKLIGLEENVPKFVKFDGKLFLQNPKEYLDMVQAKLGTVIFSKPFDLAASVETDKIENYTQLKLWCQRNAKNSYMLLEEFIPGVTYHVDSFVRDTEILRIDINVKLNPASDFLLGKIFGSMSLSKTESDWEKIFKLNRKLITLLNPPNGCTDIDLIKTARQNFKFLECNVRTPAEFIPTMYKIATDFDYYVAHYKLQMGLDIDAQLNESEKLYCAYVTVPQKKGILHKCFEPKHLSSSFSIKWFYQPGELLIDPNSLRDFVCAIILTNKNYNNLKNDFISLQNHTFYTVKNVSKYQLELFHDQQAKDQIKFSNLLRELIYD